MPKPKPKPQQLSLVDAPYSGVLHHNRRLFSDHFLDELLPNKEPWRQHWQQLRVEAAPIMESLKQRFAAFAPTDATNEAQTEQEWMRPVLQELGHSFEVQASLKVPGNKVQRPDYVFYRDEAQRLANRNSTVDEDAGRHGAFAVGDAKRWERSLDHMLKGSSDEDNNNPAFQIFFYMLHSGLPWGILSNGRRWRLYHERTAHKLEVCYEVDLPDLLASNDVEKFLYFYAFFRRAAFEPGPLGLEQLLQASADYAQQVSDNLRQQVYDALCDVAQGFLDYTENKLVPTPDTCRLLYGSSLILLYRLLFILYAEARDLLPLQDNRSYRRRYSLDAIKRDAAEELKEGLLIPTSGVIWQRLKTLFTSIDKGSKPLNVTTFNGGLFDPGQDEYHAFLERYTVGDLSLCRAIDKLARVNEQFIDYRDLAERHLGTIYEGLLEYTLQVATEPMAELRSSSKIVPTQGVPARDIARTYDSGRVYLVTDRGERKITGSYYTPDYVVKYMVEQTLGPVLSEATAALGASPNDAEKIRAVLAVNVLDPSMGSGHFPVEVMEYIARYLVELGVQADETSESDLTYWKRRVAQQCIYGVDLNPLAVELAKLSLWLATAARDRPLNFLDHHLRPGNALAGSWLKDVAAGQHPGAKQAQRKAQEALEAEKAAGQLSLLDDEEFRQEVGAALDVMSTIEQNPGITVENVKAQEAAYEQLRQRFTGRYLYLANLGAALYYNIEVGEDVWRLLANYALGKTDNYTPEMEARFTILLEQATKLSTGGKRFFHWELEFPDVFYDHNGQPLGDKAGFDVVIGNPPYVRQEKLQEDKPFFQEHYEVYHGVADLFVYFFAQGLNLLRQGGRLAYISSNTWLRANYATSLRHYLRTQTTVETIVDLGNNRVFADAPDLTPSIQIVRKILPAGGHMAFAAIFARGEPVKTFTEQLATKLFALSIHDQLDTGWQLTSNASRALAAKLLETGRPLGEVVQGRIYRGVLTGLNEAFIIDQATRDRLVKDDPTCMAIIKPVLRGEDLRPWYQEDEGRWLIFTRRGIDIDAYPAVKAYLQQFREQLEPRPDKWSNLHTWPGRKPGPYKWYEIQDTVEYFDVFEQSKVFWPDITRKSRFSWGEPGVYIGNTGYCVPATSHVLLGILASRTLWYILSHISQPLGERAGTLIYRLFRQFMERLPIPLLDDAQHDHIGKLAQQITEKAKQRYEVRHKTTHRIQSDLGTADRKPNQQLAEWWELPFKAFRDEVVKSFKRDIAVKDRDGWETLLRERTAEIEKLTGEIVRLETELNAAVYEAFGLNEAEIALIEQETKYQYGEW